MIYSGSQYKEIDKQSLILKLLYKVDIWRKLLMISQQRPSTPLNQIISLLPSGGGWCIMVAFFFYSNNLYLCNANSARKPISRTLFLLSSINYLDYLPLLCVVEKHWCVQNLWLWETHKACGFLTVILIHRVTRNFRITKVFFFLWM
jgi:hypothetical protein